VGYYACEIGDLGVHSVMLNVSDLQRNEPEAYPPLSCANAPLTSTQSHWIMHRILVYVGKQPRLRAQRAAEEAADQRDRIARVQVSDDVWAAFRAGLGTTPVNVALGAMVRREVGRKARRSANDADGIRVALADAREVADELTSLIARLERAAANESRSYNDKSPSRTKPATGYPPSRELRSTLWSPRPDRTASC
jgi:hypothetical protein